MDFSVWSLYTILVISWEVGFIERIPVLFYRTRQLEKRMDRQSDNLNDRFNVSVDLMQHLSNRL